MIEWVAGNKGKKLLAFLDIFIRLQQLNLYPFDPGLFSFEFNSASIYWVLAVCTSGHFKRRDLASFPITSTCPTPEHPEEAYKLSMFVVVAMQNTVSNEPPAIPPPMIPVSPSLPLSLSLSRNIQ